MTTLLDFLNPINTAVEAGKNIADVIIANKDRQDRETTSIIADLTELMSELSKTHASIVKMVSPLRRIKDDPATFANDFQAVYYDFRDFYDAFDFMEARTHCHKIRQIQNRMEKRKPRFGSGKEWDELYQILQWLGGGDLDIIEYRYKPFMESFNDVMKNIDELVHLNDIPQAIEKKHTFLAELEPEYNLNKAKLETMTSLVGELTARL